MKIAVACCTKRPWLWGNIAENINRQTRAPDAVALVVSEKDDDTRLRLEFLSHVSAPVQFKVVPDRYGHGEKLSKAVQEAIDLFEANWISIFDDDDYYGDNYLMSVSEMAALHPEAWLLGKNVVNVRWLGGKRAGQTSAIKAACPDCAELAGLSIEGTLTISAAAWAAHSDWRFPKDIVGIDFDFFRQAQAHNAPMFNVPQADFWLQRYGDDKHQHTWAYQGDTA